MEKIIHSLISNWIKGVDTYTHNGSTWLIFTDSKKWVVELTESKTLWYNYNFFKQIFEFTSLDVVENQHYITKWVEDNVIGGVKRTMSETIPDSFLIEDTIQNGVKETKISPTHTEYGDWLDGDERLDEIIKNGVKETIECDWKIPKYVINEVIIEGVKETNHVDVMKFFDNKMEDILKNGVKETQFNDNENKSWVEGVIKGGVKVTLNTEYMPTSMVEDIIQSGVKHTEYGDWLDGDERLGDIIENGVKETNYDTDNYTDDVNEVIREGVKETKTPGNGDLKSTVEWMKENNSNSYTKMIDDVIDNGVKETKSIGNESPNYPSSVINHIIKEGEKVNGTYAGGQRQSEKCKSVVEYGTKNPTD